MELGRLERIDARQIWANEAMHFTPWLAQEHNLALLGEAIGIELELEAQEKSVGPFSADILCKDTVTGNWVLIENQLERTDHRHLGQLITYASGLKAVTIVWIANPFTEEHRSALDWLNEITDSRFNFFGLEVELWKIGDSPAAPKFNIVAKPNDWSKTVSASVADVERRAPSGAKSLQLRFWTFFRDHLITTKSAVRPTKPNPCHWMNMGLGRGGFRLGAIASLWNNQSGSYDSGEIRAEVQLYDDNAKQYFQELQRYSHEIEGELGYPLFWHNPPPPRNACRMYVRQDADLEDETRWPEYAEWLRVHLEDIQRVFSNRIKQL